MLRRPRSLRLALVVVGVVAVIASGTAAGTTAGSWPRDESVGFCLESVPDELNQVQAQNQLEDILDNWEDAAGAVIGQAITLYVDCNSPDYTITADASCKMAATTGSSEICFGDPADDRWTISKTTGRYPWPAVMAHEVGHAIGLGHSGTSTWSRDGYLPTMGAGISLGEGNAMKTIELDDYGGAVWVRDDGVEHFWSANPGFEDGSFGWTFANVTLPSAGHAITGTAGVELFGNQYQNGTAHLDHTYDPWQDFGSGRVVTGMDTTPVLWFNARIRRTQGEPPTTDLVKVKTKLRIIAFTGRDEDGDVVAKRFSSPTIGAWGSLTTEASCTPTSTALNCQGSANGVVLPSFMSGQLEKWRAAVVRIRVVNDSGVDVDIDEVGIFGAMP